MNILRKNTIQFYMPKLLLSNSGFYKMSKLFFSNYAIAFLCLFTTTLVGCDSKPIINSNTPPFSIAKIQIGMDINEAKKILNIGYCEQRKENLVQCFYSPEKEIIVLFGAELEDIKYSYRPIEKSIVMISTKTKDQLINRFILEDKWNLKNKCLDYFAAEKLSQYSNDGALIMQQLRDWNIAPIGYSDYICLSDDKLLIDVQQFKSNDSEYQRINIFPPTDIPRNFIKKALILMNEIQSIDNSLNNNQQKN